jgi:hypothetical protein
MVAKEAFAHLPGHALVEPNHAFAGHAAGFTARNDWGLNATESGRGMMLADVDGDSDLDVVINNLNAPATVFENRLCHEGTPLTVTLLDPTTPNSDAFGSIVKLTAGDRVWVRRHDATRGYLSGLSGPIHLAVPHDATRTNLELEVVWPDGGTSRADVPHGVQAVTVTRSGDMP